MYSAGECPICGFLGPLYFVKVPSSGTIFIACTMCGVAWKTPPPPMTVDTIDPISDYAPDGFILPSRQEIDDAGMGGYIQNEAEMTQEKVQQEFEGYLIKPK